MGDFYWAVLMGLAFVGSWFILSTILVHYLTHLLNLKGDDAFMPREKPLYHDTLSSVRARATELFPGELLFGPTKVAKILGRSRAWVYRHYGSFNSMTVEQIASLIC